MNVELRAEARRDVLDGASFFDGQRDGLGDYFIDCIFDDLRELEAQAALHEVVFGLHRKLVSRFPFAIYYLADNETLDVVAILDCRRDPKLIADTISSRND